MKINFPKYIFFGIVIIIVGLAIYLIYNEQKEGRVKIEEAKSMLVIEPQINIGIAEYDTINPILSKSKDVQYISNLIYDSLIKVTKDFKAENNILEEWSKINETTYLLRLKGDILWHNGISLSAEDIRFTIDGIKNLAVDSIYKKNVENIVNVEVIDNYTIKIYLNKEIPFFEYMLTFPILSREEYNEKLESINNIPVGTGEYKIKEIKSEEIILEKRNEEIKSKIEIINIKIYNSPIDLYNNLSRENVDIINTSNIEYEKYVGEIGFNKSKSTERTYGYLAINNNNKILSNKEVRQAINYAIDKKYIVYNEYQNEYFVSDFPLDYGSYLYNSEKSEINLDKAKNVLLSNGWLYENNVWKKQGVTNGLKLNLIINEKNIKNLLVAENIKGQLERIGIKVNIQKVSPNNLEKYIENKNYELILIEDIITVSPNLNYYLGIDNIFNYYNEEIINTLKEVNSIQNEEILKEKYSRIIEIYNEEMPFISLYFNSNILITSSKIKGTIEHNWYNIFYNVNNWYKVDK